MEQLEARRAHNPEVAGSNPVPATIKILPWPLGQAVKTPPFHGGNRGSNPLGVTIFLKRNTMKYQQLELRLLAVLIIHGSIAQLGEHLPYKQRVIGSSPITPTICGLVVQLVRTPACHAGGREFESLLGRQ